MILSKQSISVIFLIVLLLLLLFTFCINCSEVYADEVTSYKIEYIEITEDSNFSLPLPERFNTNGSHSLGFSLDADVTSSNNYYVAPAGSYNRTSDTGVFFLIVPSTGYVSCQYGNSWIESNNNTRIVGRHVITERFAYGSQVLSVDGTTYKSYSYKPSTAYSMDSIGIFSRTFTSGSGNICAFKGKVYNLQVLYDDVVIYNFIPYVYNNNVGLLDIISNDFYVPNLGSWIAGPSIEVDNPDEPVNPEHPSWTPGSSGGNPDIDNNSVFILFMSILGIVWSGLSSINVPVINIPFSYFLIGIFVLYTIAGIINNIVFNDSEGDK